MPLDMIPSRNVVVAGSRTSLRLEPEVFAALDDICAREGLTLSALCNHLLAVHDRRTSLSSRLRVYALTYYRAIVQDLERQAPCKAG